MKVLKLLGCLGLLACMLAGCGTGTTAETTAADTTVADTTEEVIPMTEIDNGLAQSKSYYTNKLCDGTADPFILEHDGTYYLYCTGGSKYYVRTSKDLACKEGIMCGISSGTNVAAAMKLAKVLGKGKTVVTVLPDTAERYFSTPLFED